MRLASTQKTVLPNTETNIDKIWYSKNTIYIVSLKMKRQIKIIEIHKIDEIVYF